MYLLHCYNIMVTLVLPYLHKFVSLVLKMLSSGTGRDNHFVHLPYRQVLGHIIIKLSVFGAAI